MRRPFSASPPDQRLAVRGQLVVLRPGRLVLAQPLLDLLRRMFRRPPPAGPARPPAALLFQEFVELLRQQIIRAGRLHLAEDRVGPLPLDDLAGLDGLRQQRQRLGRLRGRQQPPALGSHQRLRVGQRRLHRPVQVRVLQRPQRPQRLDAHPGRPFDVAGRLQQHRADLLDAQLDRRLDGRLTHLVGAAEDASQRGPEGVGGGSGGAAPAAATRPSRGRGRPASSSRPVPSAPRCAVPPAHRPGRRRRPRPRRFPCCPRRKLALRTR